MTSARPVRHAQAQSSLAARTFSGAASLCWCSDAQPAPRSPSESTI